ncbi:unnamed protein product [Rotaria sp. Silwood1]|nr:unnamed protein product [Rotaria sp. Silwood1]
MKVRGLSNLEEESKKLFMLDDELETQWQKTYDFYWNERLCHDYERIENEICQCFNALMNDEKGIMIGLDSISSLKDLLITSMKLSSEPDFKLEIRIGLGGTHDLVNLRAPSYAVSGIYLLEQLLKLRDKFPRIEYVSGIIKIFKDKRLKLLFILFKKKIFQQ